MDVLDFSNITDNDLYIDDAKITNSNDENLNISWADLVEEELGNSLSDKKLVGSINNKISTNEKNISIEKILESDIKKINDITLLEYENILCIDLRKCVKNMLESYNKEPLNIDTFITKLEWLKMTSKYLSEKIGQSPYQNENKSNKMFQRSSYKFCNFNYECEFNYNAKKYTGCFAQHYVHNIVYADLVTLINCIKKLYQSNEFKISLDQLKELKKTTSTLSFVINHMFEELKNIQTASDKTNCHIDRRTNKKCKSKNKSKESKK